MKIRSHHIQEKSKKTLTAIGEGLSYTFRHPVISILVLLAGMVSIFGWSYTTLLPLIARNKFGLGASGLGYMYAASGLGSLLAALLIGGFSRRISPVLCIFGGNFMFVISIILFTFTNQLPWALFLLFLAGMGLLAQAAMINTSIQRLVRDNFRGRVMSIYILMFLGMTPLGNLQIGYISEILSIEIAIRIGATIVFFFGLLIFLFKDKILQSYEIYKKKNNYK